MSRFVLELMTSALEAMQMYLAVMEVYPEVVEASRPSGSGCSMAAEYVVSSFLDSLLFHEIIKHVKAVSVDCVKDLNELLLKEVELLRSFLRNEHQDLNDLVTGVNLAYKSEYAIDSCSAGRDGPGWCCIPGVFDVTEGIQLVKTVSGLHMNKMLDLCAVQVNQRTNEIVMSLNDQVEMIINRLMRESLQYDIVLVIGMTGLGKTTHVKNVYKDPSIMYHFQTSP